MVCLRARHEVNTTRTPWDASPSLPIPDTTYPKKEKMTPPRIRHCSHKALLPPTKPEHDAQVRAFLGSFHHEVSTSVSSARRRRHGVGRGQPFTDPSPSTIPHICSSSPTLEASCPLPFKFTQDPLFFFCVCENVDNSTVKLGSSE